MNLKGWLSRYFRAELIKHEAQFPCPKCQHPNFYFNMRKRVGYCHHANCHYAPGMAELIEIAGCEPDSSFLSSRVTAEEEAPPPEEITFPEGCKPLMEMVDGQLESEFPIAVNRIWNDRGVDPHKMWRYNIHIGGNRVYVPVYQDGKMMSYVGRACWWLPYQPFQRYKYPKGTSIANYLFDWPIARTWDRLTLVENTFNAMWLSDYQVTTNFGSHLSDIQIDQITHGRAGKNGTILLLWDEGADQSAEKAVKKLRKKGFTAGYMQINGQPDDHSFLELETRIEHSHLWLEGKAPWMTFRTKP